MRRINEDYPLFDVIIEVIGVMPVDLTRQPIKEGTIHKVYLIKFNYISIL